jgi:HEAT repeat protein
MSCFNRRVGAWCATGALCLAAGTLTVSILRAEGERRERDVLNNVSTLLDTPEDVHRDVYAIFAQREAMVQRCLQIIDPQNKQEYADKQRAAAAFLLGEFRAIEAVPFLLAMLREEVKTRPTVFWDPSPFDFPARVALGKLGRDALPAVIEVLKETDDPALRQDCIGLIRQKVGPKRFLLDTLGNLAGREQDPVKAQRLTDARTWVDLKFKQAEEFPY